MAGDVTSLENFHFNSLHKFLRPTYARLNRDLDASKEDKLALLRQITAEFFARMRMYRGIPLEKIAEELRVEIETLAEAEVGNRKFTVEMESIYTWACGAHRESDFFAQKTHEFMHPSIKEKNLDVARAALRQCGQMFAGVDYQKLGSGESKVIPFPKK